MIKTMRDAAHNYPWLLKSIMGILAIAFVITMGWWGFGEQAGGPVAKIGEQSVTLDEFKRTYENMHRIYKDNVKTDFKEEEFKDFVMGQLVDSRVWIIAAQEMGVRVSDADLRELIMQTPVFQKNGAFDPEHYKRILAANHLTPAAFESIQHQEVLANKARMIVRDSVALTPEEIAEGQSLMTRPADGNDPAKMAEAKQRVLDDMLLQKQQRALVSFQQSMKAKIPVTIRRELL
ncbi:SurA N-terminal domain-containing protein [Nitrospira sp. CMX1]|nr:SurA N-terminal domain-containing protein [Nitrospira sp.]